MEAESGKNFELIVLVIVVCLALFVSIGAVWDSKIAHDFPFGYSASDAFQHQIRAESIKDMGNYQKEAAYIAKGFDDVVGFYPPLIYHLAISLSAVSGLQTYDIIFFIVFAAAVLSIVMMYFIIRKFNKSVALLSLP